jgi:hypothetical protein
MGSHTPLAEIFRSILATLPALAFAGCACPEYRIVVPISRSQVPARALAAGWLNALTQQECDTLCGAPGIAVRGCSLVEVCTGASTSECIGGARVWPMDGSALDAGTPMRGYGVQCTVVYGCTGGRRPYGFDVERFDERSVGAYLARQSALEAASVPAFEQLAQRLSALGAPAEFVERALDAAVDEVAHAAAMKSLAAREQAKVPAFAQRPQGEPSLEELATDNAVEGCVRETFAALLAVHQREHGTDPSIREAFSTIADDETRHAELSRDVHRWALALLADRERTRVEAAMRAAIDELRIECAAPCLAERERARLGLPDERGMLAMIAQLDRALWSSSSRRSSEAIAHTNSSALREKPANTQREERS